MPDNPMIIGDVNIPWNKTDNLDTTILNEILELYNLELHVSTPTHKLGSTINRVLGIKNSREFQDLCTYDSLSDHCNIEWIYNINKLNSVITRSFARKLKKINHDKPRPWSSK